MHERCKELFLLDRNYIMERLRLCDSEEQSTVNVA